MVALLGTVGVGLAYPLALPRPVKRLTFRGRQAVPLRLLMKVGRAVVAPERYFPERPVLQRVEDSLQFRQ